VSLDLNKENQLLEQGRQYYEKKNYKLAREVLEEVIVINPQSSEAYFLLANIFHVIGEVGKAIKAFHKVLEFDNNHTDAAVSLSVLYNDIGRYEDAKKIFNRVNERVKAVKDSSIEDVHINRKFSLKHMELADLYLTYNRYDEALFEYNKAVGLDPSNLDSRVKVAKVYAKKGFLNKAFDELKRVKHENPSYLPARVALGVLYYGNGNILEAQSEWKKVLSKNPSNEEASMYLNLSQTATETAL